VIIHDVKQGEESWYACRRGIPTSSRFDEIITPKTGKLSASARKYAYWLIAEKVLNRSLESIDNLQWVEHGRENEPTAVAAYEFITGTETKPVGFITTDDGRWGASPDRLLIGENGGLEVKCVAPNTMIGYMVDGFGDAYKVQVNGQMLVAELDFVDRYAWHAEMPAVRVRTYRDEPYIKILSAALNDFSDMLAEMEEKVREQGAFYERAKFLTPVDQISDAAEEIAEIAGRF